MTLNYTGERAIPWNGAVGVNVMTHHIKRYAWATSYAWQKSVADLGCGVGYGAYMLSWVSRSVIGCDIDHRAIAYANDTFRAGNLRYETLDISEGVPRVQVYTAFEVIEHLDDPLPMLTMIDEVGGALVWSIPINSNTIWHRQVYNEGDIVSLMDGSTFYYQGAGGEIVLAESAQFSPVYILGVRE